jgi:hypothetical protein
MGGSRRYGPNRWGDGFREEVLARDVATFEQAKAYRNHKSSKDDPVFGRVKFAHFREDDGVVELITEYFGNQKVADAHGGKVADDEIESLMKVGYIPVSMGSLVPGDICVVCNHFAKKPADRCSSKREGGSCPMFGCKTGMLQIDDTGRLQYVDNPRNRFYDISKVKVGADPIAYGSLLPVGDFYADMSSHTKSASLFAEISDNVIATPEVDRYLTTIFELSHVEHKLASFLADDDCTYAVGCHYAGDLSSATYHTLASMSDAAVGSCVNGELGAADVVDFRKFASVSVGDAAAMSLLGFIPDLFTRIRQQGLSSKIASMAASLAKFSPITTRKFASVVDSRLDLEKIRRESFQRVAGGSRASVVNSRPSDDVIPDVIMKYAAIRVLLDANINGNAEHRFVTFNRNSTRLEI